MSNVSKLITRRAALTAGAAALAAWVLSPARQKARAQKATLLARQVPQLPTEPDDALWDQAEALEVPLGPQAVVKPRTYEVGVKAVQARALYDGERLGFLLEWGDPTREAGIGRVDAFRDAVAVQFPADPSRATPFFGMGQQNGPATIYHWKADWQFGPNYDVDEQFPGMAVDVYPLSGKPAGQIPEGADYGQPGGVKAFVTAWAVGNTLADTDLQSRTPVEKLEAEGFGTVHSATAQDGQGKGAYRDGKWRVLISFPRAQDRFTFEKGQTAPVAFAAWDGSFKERGGEKGVSTWYFLSLEQPVRALAYISPVMVVVGVVLVQWLGLRWLRRQKAGPGAPQ